MTAGEVFDDGNDHVIRVGGVAGWAFAVAPGYTTLTSLQERALSADGVDVIVLSGNGNADRIFIHLRDGACVSGFEPGNAQHRSGDDPDRWVPALQRVGLLTPEGLSALAFSETWVDVRRLMLRMAEDEFQLELPQMDFDGPLRAVRVAPR
ncbi:DUF6461 domain-containing protein [Streptomycetaceae bacterium NBC_01309]